MVDAVVRERGQHVTYESKHWQRLFNIIPTLFDTLFVALSGMACSRPAAAAAAADSGRAHAGAGATGAGGEGRGQDEMEGVVLAPEACRQALSSGPGNLGSTGAATSGRRVRQPCRGL